MKRDKRKCEAIEQTLAYCQTSKLTDWELVDFVTRLVHEKMTYSMEIPLKGPYKAFSLGKGYCVQQAFCMRYLLTSLGFKDEIVYCSKCRNRKTGSILGHTWNRVTIAGITKDVCSCRPGNVAGQVHFEPLGSVKPYKGFVVIGGYLGSIPICIKKSLHKG